MNALEVKGLSRSFGSLKAVDNVSFNIPEGSVFGLIGRNGAGKTTTIRMLMNIYSPDSGEVFLRGSKITSEFKKNVGYLPEERGLYKKMKVIDTLIYFAELKGRNGKEIEKKALAYLKKFDLLDRKNSKVEELSKGNQQKIQFISTILHDPDFIILDEPFTGLDPVNTNIIKEIILSLKASGKVVILSTHLMDFAERLCDHLAMIDKGKIILSGSINEIKQKYAQKNVSIVYEGDISFLNRLPYVDKIENFGNSAGIKLKDSSYIQELLKSLVNEGIIINNFKANEISLHEIFIMLAGSDDAGLKEERVYAEL
jgi:ABC-2 type transport system ATP-binding protein